MAQEEGVTIPHLLTSDKITDVPFITPRES